MSLLSGDLTTPARLGIWLPNLTSGSNTVISLLIAAETALIYGKLNRARLYNQTFTRIFDGVGTYQIVLPDYPVTSILSVQVGQRVIQNAPLVIPGSSIVSGSTSYGWRFVPWSGNLPGENAVLEFVNGSWGYYSQGIRVVYNAGYLIQNEPQTVPAAPYVVTVLQPQGIWSRDGGVIYAATGVALVAVGNSPVLGQYIPPTDTALGQYTFSAADAGANLLFSYSFIPANLELACIQMVAESYGYRERIGQLDKSLGGQETVRFMRGGLPRSVFPDLPPEVEGLIWPYVNVVPPNIGAPV